MRIQSIDAVSGQKSGFSYGEPQRLDQKSLAVVLPILRVTSIERSYTTFPEVPDGCLIFDTGSISKMRAENKTKSNVFIRSGTLFAGATQTRALQRSVVIFPGEKIDMDVRCVHQSHGISGGSKVSYGGVTPLNMDQKCYTTGYTPADQGKYWQSVFETTSMYAKMTGKKAASAGPIGSSGILRRRAGGQSLGGQSQYLGSTMKSSYHEDAPITASTSGMSADSEIGEIEAGPIGAVMGASSYLSSPISPGMDDLASHMDDFATSFDSLLSKLERNKNQVGLGLINQNGVETIEFFDHETSWSALHESAIKRIGSHVISKADDSVFEYKPEAAKGQINKVLDLDWDTKKIWGHKSSDGEPSVLITGLSAENFVGEAVEINDTLIHLVLLKRSA